MEAWPDFTFLPRGPCTLALYPVLKGGKKKGRDRAALCLLDKFR